MKDLTQKEFDMIREYIKKNFGINLADEKKSLIYSRLRIVLSEKGFSDFTEYFNYLINDKSGEAVIQFIDKVTTNHTFFMREVDHFEYFQKNVLPYIEKTYASQRDFRLWCAGCSSGEEPYTLQMIMQDFFKDKQPPWELSILATDISTNVLEKAIRGVYSKESVSTLPDKWVKAYFTPAGNDFSIKDEIKKMIIFRKINLMDEKFPFKKPLQVIFCRNVMIYFDNETRIKLVEKFYNALAPGGYLFIGHSESLNRSDTKFDYIMPAVYRRPENG